ncbi:Coiled-coil domain-containing protein [Entamoeba marina]
MAERKATNKYIPPDFDPAIHKSVNDYHKIHPLRNRARKINQGILIIRIELPFGIWCDRCHSLHGKGTRFNAEKKSVGMYYSTKIFELSFKCKDCVNKIVLRTDPENTRYIVVIQLVDVDDPIQRLEKDQEQKDDFDCMKQEIDKRYEQVETHSANDFDLNARIRKRRKVC